MKRRHLWELPCPARATVLWTSFTWQELRQIARGLGILLRLQPLPDPSARATAVMGAVQHLCAQAGALTERLEDLLAAAHEDAVLQVEARDPDELMQWCPVELARSPVAIAGLIWAVASDPRPELRRIEDCLSWRLYTQGLRALAFGKVEVIAI